MTDATLPRSAGEAGAAPRWLITVSIMLATVLQTLDTTIANVALPHMQGSMSATQGQIAWVLTSYIVAAAIMTPPTGVLARRMGRKRLFLAAVIGFTAASMLCGMATSLYEIVAFRLFQGACGAALVPLSQAVLLDTFPGEQHGRAMAMWGMGVMIGPILGPTLGGYLTETHSWRWVFYINVPFGILAFLGILAFVPETVREARARFDFFGFALLSLAIGALQLMLDRGQSQDWLSSNEIIAEATVAGLALYMFLVHMFTADAPFIEPGLFRDRNFAAGLLLIFVIGIILLATIALLPPFLQNLMGYPVLTTGFVLAPRGIGTMIAMMVVGRLIGRIDSRWLMLGGIGLTAFSLWEMAGFTADMPMWPVIRSGIVQGLGLGFIFVPMATVTFATLAVRYRSEGTAMFSLMRNIGSSIGISIMFTLLAQNTQANHAVLSATVTPFRGADALSALPRLWDWATTAGAMALNGEITRQAAVIAYVTDFRVMMWVTLVSAPLVLLLRTHADGHAPAPMIH